jgi:hypothetical protein
LDAGLLERDTLEAPPPPYERDGEETDGLLRDGGAEKPERVLPPGFAGDRPTAGELFAEGEVKLRELETELPEVPTEDRPA